MGGGLPSFSKEEILERKALVYHCLFPQPPSGVYSSLVVPASEGAELKPAPWLPLTSLVSQVPLCSPVLLPSHDQFTKPRFPAGRKIHAFCLMADLLLLLYMVNIAKQSTAA